MYQIKCDDDILYDPRVEELILLEPRCKLKANAVGEASFGILPSHPFYDKLKKMKSVFEIQQNGQVIFRGRMTVGSTDFRGRLDVDLEGLLACANDTLIPPHSFPADFADAAMAENVVELYLQWILDQHNAHVQGWQRLHLGNVTVADPNNYIFREATEYTSTWDTLKEKLFESGLGGFLCVRYEEDGTYIDYLSEFPLTNTQHITFGENMLDMTRQSDASETYSAMLPLGKDGITIASLEDKDLTDDIVKEGMYIYSRSAVEEIGWVCVPISESKFDDVTEADNLLDRGVEYLTGTAMATSESMEIKAVDLHLTDSEIKALRIYRNVMIDFPNDRKRNTSQALLELDLDIANPQNTVIVVGDTVRTMLDIQAKKQSGTASRIEQAVQTAQNTLGAVETIDSDVQQRFDQVYQYIGFGDDGVAICANGTGLGIGQAAEEPNTFAIGMPTKLNAGISYVPTAKANSSRLALGVGKLLWSGEWSPSTPSITVPEIGSYTLLRLRLKDTAVSILASVDGEHLTGFGGCAEPDGQRNYAISATVDGTTATLTACSDILHTTESSAFAQASITDVWGIF